MRLHPTTRLLTLLMAVLLVGTLVVPADGKRKRPRRYTAEGQILLDWTICQTGATLTIGIQSFRDPAPSDEPAPSVKITAVRPTARGDSIIKDELPNGYPIKDVPDYSLWEGWITGVEQVVTDTPLDMNGEVDAMPVGYDEAQPDGFPIPPKDTLGRPIVIVIDDQRIPVEDFMNDPIVHVPYNLDTGRATAELDIVGVGEGEGEADGFYSDGTIELGVDSITHQAGSYETPGGLLYPAEGHLPVELIWKDPLRVGSFIHLDLGEPVDLPLFEVVSCHEGGEPDGSSPGVKSPGPSLTTEEIHDLSARIDKNRQVGRGPGGSLVPRSECTIVGTPGDDRIEGTPGHDVICGLGGKDVIDGDRGIDLIDGADGNDRLRGGSDNDVLLGLRGDDRLTGNSRNDRASGGAGIDRVRGSSGNDPLLSGGWGGDRLSGGQGHDRIRGGSGRDRIGARDRTRDRVDGGSGWDRATVDRVGSTVRARRLADRVRRVERLL